jgi:hypothetical protein
MTEYIATPDGQIQADFARRVGQVLLHYEAGPALGQPQDSYEATLTICLLQALLTNRVELIDKRLKNDITRLTQDASRSVEEAPALFGLNLPCITQQWPSDRPLRYREIFKCLRNALSHPLPQKANGLPTTGYTTWNSPSEMIEGFQFIQSPWVNRSGSDVTDSFKVEDKERPKLQKVMENWRSNYGTSGLTVQPGRDGLNRIFLGEQRFIPYLRLDISTTQLRTMTLNLSERLAEPLSVVRSESSRVRTNT